MREEELEVLTQKNVHFRCVGNVAFPPLPFLVHHSLPGDLGEGAVKEVQLFLVCGKRREAIELRKAFEIALELFPSCSD